MGIFAMMALGPELRRRLRRPARPRLRRLLRDRLVHGGLARVVAVRARQHPLRRHRRHSGADGDPHLDLARADRSPESSQPLAGVLIGLPTLRLRGDYLAIVTLGFGEIMPQIVAERRQPVRRVQPDERHRRHHPDRPARLRQLAPPHLGLPANYLHARHERPTALTSGRVLVLVLITIFCSARLRDSRLGRAWIAIREDEVAAAAMGIPLMRTKTWAYATGAFFGGVAGAYYASYNGSAFPDEFYFNISVFILVHGHPRRDGQHLGRHLRGLLPRPISNREGLPNIGAWLNGHFGPGGSDFQIWHTPLDVPLYEFGIYGVILVVVMLLPTRGPDPEPSPRRRVPRRRARRAALARRRAPMLMTEALLQTHSSAQGVRRSRRGRRHRLRRAGRLDRQPDRAERCRQDDVLQHAHGRLQADRGSRRLRRART